MKLVTTLDLNGNQVLNAVFQNLATAPGGAKEGQHYYDTALKTPRFYNGTAWVNLDATKASGIPISALATDPLARANHTGTQTASTISDFTTAVQSIKWNTLATPTTTVNAGGQVISNVGTPSANTDAATKAYVDTAVANAKAGLDVKDSVRAATTANITLSGLQTIDGVSVAAGDRVLVKNQTTASENGIYLAASGAWPRTTDAAQGTLTPDAFAFVEEGSTLSGSQWRVTNTGAITVGSTPITWAQFGGGGGYTQGNGIQISGNVISVVAAPSGGLAVGASGVSVDTAVVVRKFSATVGDGSTSSFALTHNLGTQDITVAVREISTNALVLVDVTATNANSATVTFGSAPAANTYRVVIHG